MSHGLKSVKISHSIELDSLRKFVQEKIIPGASERDEKEAFPLDLYRGLHALGWMDSAVPQELGGLGLPTSDLIWFARELAYGSCGMATSVAANLAAVTPIVLHAEAPVRAEFAKRVTDQLSFTSFCFTEPDTGSDIMRIRTTARKVEGGYILKGQKCFISNANYADQFLIVAKVEGVENPKNAFTLFLVPREAKGLSLGQPYKKMGNRDANTSEVFIDNVFVPQDHRIGAEGAGLKIAVQSLQKSRTFFAASAVGLCQRASDLVKDELSKRIRYDKPLLANPVIQGFLAQLHTEMQAAWYLTCAAAEKWDSGDHRSLTESSMAKLYAGQTAVKVLAGAMELFGGWGYMREYEIERLYRDAKLLDIIEGPTFVQQAIIAKELFPDLRTAEKKGVTKAA